jgi:hypothetical protein
MSTTDSIQTTSEQNLRSKKIVTDFGIRTFYRATNSPAICLPKIAVDNCRMLDTKKVRVLLVDEENERYIKLVPIANKNGGEIQ